jgi:hypothetical protein
VVGIVLSNCGKFIMAILKSSLLSKSGRKLTIDVKFKVNVKKQRQGKLFLLLPLSQESSFQSLDY